MDARAATRKVSDGSLAVWFSMLRAITPSECSSRVGWEVVLIVASVRFATAGRMQVSLCHEAKLRVALLANPSPPDQRAGDCQQRECEAGGAGQQTRRPPEKVAGVDLAIPQLDDSIGQRCRPRGLHEQDASRRRIEIDIGASDGGSILREFHPDANGT